MAFRSGVVRACWPWSGTTLFDDDGRMRDGEKREKPVGEAYSAGLGGGESDFGFTGLDCMRKAGGLNDDLAAFCVGPDEKGEIALRVKGAFACRACLRLGDFGQGGHDEAGTGGAVEGCVRCGDGFSGFGHEGAPVDRLTAVLHVEDESGAIAIGIRVVAESQVVGEDRQQAGPLHGDGNAALPIGQRMGSCGFVPGRMGAIVGGIALPQRRKQLLVHDREGGVDSLRRGRIRRKNDRQGFDAGAKLPCCTEGEGARWVGRMGLCGGGSQDAERRAEENGDARARRGQSHFFGRR